MTEFMSFRNQLFSGIKRIWNELLNLLFPQDVGCLCCDRALGPDEQDGVCNACMQALEALEIRQQIRTEKEPPPEGISYVSCAYPYTAQARRLIIRLKFHYVRAAAIPLGKAMAMLPAGEADLLVPVPTTKRRLRERGFNQARLLCEVIAEETGMPMEDVLVRRDDRRAQSRLSGQLRRGNVSGTMSAERSVAGKRILLVDDVYTTGATACEAARALLAAGAVSVGVIAAARSVYEQEEEKRTELPFAFKNHDMD